MDTQLKGTAHDIDRPPTLRPGPGSRAEATGPHPRQRNGPGASPRPRGRPGYGLRRAGRSLAGSFSHCNPANMTKRDRRAIRVPTPVELVAVHPKPPVVRRPVVNPNHAEHDGLHELKTGRPGEVEDAPDFGTQAQSSGLSGSTCPPRFLEPPARDQPTQMPFRHAWVDRAVAAVQLQNARLNPRTHYVMASLSLANSSHGRLARKQGHGSPHPNRAHPGTPGGAPPSPPATAGAPAAHLGGGRTDDPRSAAMADGSVRRSHPPIMLQPLSPVNAHRRCAYTTVAADLRSRHGTG